MLSLEAPISPFAAMVIATWLVCVLLELVFEIWDSDRVGRWLRPLHSRRLARANFSRMLRRHGIEPGTWLASTPSREVREQLPRCEHCTEKAKCENALRAEYPLRDRIDFCPNRKAIERFVDSD